jgi:hypothetical protein
MDLTHQRCFTATSLVQLLEAGGLAEARPTPLRNVNWRDGTRLAAEHAFHLCLFYLTGRRSERFFTQNIHAVAYRPTDVGSLR